MQKMYTLACATGVALFSSCAGWLDAEALAWEMASAPVQGDL